MVTKTIGTSYRPNSKEVKRYLEKWQTLENYRLQEDALNKLFVELCPKYNDISDILLKVAALNDFYSTNIYSVFSVARRIKDLNVDKRLDEGDVSLVNDIKEVMISSKVKHFYSFASKYCSHHRPTFYPIYDSYVDQVLRYFRNRDKFYKFKNGDLKEYSAFKGGLKDSAEKELTIYFYDDDADQKALIAAAKTQQIVRIRHQWPNGTRATYDLKLLGYQIMSGSADGFIQLKVSGRQASDVVWSNADDEPANEDDGE